MADFSTESLLSGKEVSSLLDWFAEKGISYPWGDNPTPYRVWISEIMLQQTVVTAAIEHFKRWMDLFPSVDALAAADEQSVLKAWEGLGYYSRARNLRKGAVYLKENHSSRLPDDYKALLKIPGIGDYTARAVLSLAFGKAYPVLDANVRRIGQRLLAQKEWSGKADDDSLMALLDNLIPQDRPGAFNCALMQLGQQVCRVRSPECTLCPLKQSCRCRELGLQSEIPEAKKRKIKEKSSSLFILIRDGRILLTRRSEGIGEGLWFIPSLPLSEKKRVSAALSPILEDRTESASSSASPLMLKERVHLYTTWKEKLSPEVYYLKSSSEDVVPLFTAGTEDQGSLKNGKEMEDGWKWVDLSHLEEFPTPSVYRKILGDIPSR